MLSYKFWILNPVKDLDEVEREQLVEADQELVHLLLDPGDEPPLDHLLGEIFMIFTKIHK